MKLRSKRCFSLIIIIVLIFGFLLWGLPYISNRQILPEELVAKQLTTSVFSADSIWDQVFLAEKVAIREKLIQFEKGDPGNYAYEAFKVTAQGQALPKGSSGKFGLKKCPYYKDKKSCERWVDAVMDEAHPALSQ